MDQSVSRPQRWRAAINRALAAITDLRGLQDERQELFDQIKDLQEKLRCVDLQAKEPLSRFADSVFDLVILQSEYDCWTVPENLSESRLQDKIHEVTSLNFKLLRESCGSLGELDIDRASDVLWEAEECDLPKGYGRD